MTLHNKCRIGLVSLTVSDLSRSLVYYQEIIGLQVHRQDDTVSAVLGAGGEDLLILHQLANPQIATRSSTGLFHFALLLPSRRDLALVLRHLLSLNMNQLGASDHLVSEALYLDDPDGHGIEIYADRPRHKWSFANGRIKMATYRLKSDELLAEISESDQWTGLPVGTTMGHVHLKVGNIAEAKRFYTDVIGFDWMIDYGRQASFVSVGGYHHHLGMNIWHSAGADPRPSNVPGLTHFVIYVPSKAEQRAVVARVAEDGGTVREEDGRCYFTDPFANLIAVVVD